MGKLRATANEARVALADAQSACEAADAKLAAREQNLEQLRHERTELQAKLSAASFARAASGLRSSDQVSATPGATQDVTATQAAAASPALVQVLELAKQAKSSAADGDVGLPLLDSFIAACSSESGGVENLELEDGPPDVSMSVEEEQVWVREQHPDADEPTVALITSTLVAARQRESRVRASKRNGNRLPALGVVKPQKKEGVVTGGTS